MIYTSVYVQLQLDQTEGAQTALFFQNCVELWFCYSVPSPAMHPAFVRSAGLAGLVSWRSRLIFRLARFAHFDHELNICWHFAIVHDPRAIAKAFAPIAHPQPYGSYGRFYCVTPKSTVCSSGVLLSSPWSPPPSSPKPIWEKGSLAAATAAAWSSSI